MCEKLLTYWRKLLVLPLDRKGKNGIVILYFYDDTRSKPPFRPGVGYIEVMQTK
jgi:hypothetical protein